LSGTPNRRPVRRVASPQVVSPTQSPPPLDLLDSGWEKPSPPSPALLSNALLSVNQDQEFEPYVASTPAISVSPSWDFSSAIPSTGLDLGLPTPPSTQDKINNILGMFDSTPSSLYAAPTSSPYYYSPATSPAPSSPPLSPPQYGLYSAQPYQAAQTASYYSYPVVSGGVVGYQQGWGGAQVAYRDPILDKIQTISAEKRDAPQASGINTLLF